MITSEYLWWCQRWFRKGLGAVRHQTITWANVHPDLCQRILSLYNWIDLYSKELIRCYSLRLQYTGGNHTKLPSSRWRRRGRSLREVFACLYFCTATDLSQIYNRETRRYGSPCTKMTDSYPFSFLYNNPRKIRRETTVGKFAPNNGRR